MTVKINDLNINYIQYGSGPDLVFLHGWGQNIEMMTPLAKQFLGYRITILDLPNFGKSDPLPTSFSIHDYVAYLKSFLTTLNIKNPILVGHSFGGRIAIVYASNNPVSKLVLFGSPCIRENKKPPQSKVLAFVKKLPGGRHLANYLKKYIGSPDYKNASPIMRDTLVKIVNEDLSSYAKKITCPTLLIWGSLDTAAPVELAKKLELLLKDGALIVLEGYTHYAYLEALPQVTKILHAFFKED